MALAYAIVEVLAAIRGELLLFAGVGLLIGGLDDLLLDLLYGARRVWRGMTIYRRYPRMTVDTLPAPARPGTMAVLIPAWDEGAVIGPMLRNCLKQWADDDHVHIFVGIYPNDRATREAVMAVAELSDRISVVVNAHAGPTTKADCLNSLWRAVLRREAAEGMPVKAIVLHDAEDIVHRDALRLMSVMVERFALVQLPVLPLVSSGSRWVAGHYCDEFAEAHAKALMIREALGAAVPSAGVGCAIARDTIAAIAGMRGGQPFDPDSLTEDYELGLAIGERGGRGVIVRMRDSTGGLVATREHFPDTLDAAVRQKARWTVGIALAGWDRLGWGRRPVEIWMRLRDRRVVLAAIILFAAYLGLVLSGLLTLVGWLVPGLVPPVAPAIMLLLDATAMLLLWRVAMRALFAGHAYGWREGLRAIPRILVGNVIAMLAARRAIAIYCRLWRGAPLVWDKTRHRFPDLSSGFAR